jgi:hypothetical protein
LELASNTKDKQERQELYEDSAAYWTGAADQFFKDDENYVKFLKLALDAHWCAGSPLKVTLPLCEKIRQAIPDVKKIWEYSEAVEYLGKWVDQVLAFEATCRKLVSEGRVTLEEAGRPMVSYVDMLKDSL